MGIAYNAYDALHGAFMIAMIPMDFLSIAQLPLTISGYLINGLCVFVE